MNPAQPIGDWLPDYWPGSLSSRDRGGLRLLAQALDDPEDDPPTRPPRFYMPHDDRSAETLAPPTEVVPPLTERPTQPPDPPAEEAAAEAELERAAGTMIPPREPTQPPKSGSFAEAAKNFGEALIEMRLTRKEIADGFRSHGSHLGVIETEVRRVNTRMTGFEKDMTDVRGEIEDLRRQLSNALRRLDDLERKAGGAVP